MGWNFPWYSSHGSDFNYAFHVKHDESVAPIEYNFRTAQELADKGEAWGTPAGSGQLTRRAHLSGKDRSDAHCRPGRRGYRRDAAVHQRLARCRRQQPRLIAS
jgi:predicted dithiol-disulfide oxidoreductase (DUF899 family)